MTIKRRHGLIHIYTGNGKGKSTAAFGLAVRASGAGMKVALYQFIKGKPYSEIGALRSLRGVTVKQCGRGCFIRHTPTTHDIERAATGLAEAIKAIHSETFDLVILDEINNALHVGLISVDHVIDMIRAKPHHVELVLTGRHCPRRLYRHADYITDMREVKHPYHRGIHGRKGIES